MYKKKFQSLSKEAQTEKNEKNDMVRGDGIGASPCHRNLANPAQPVIYTLHRLMKPTSFKVKTHVERHLRCDTERLKNTRITPLINLFEFFEQQYSQDSGLQKIPNCDTEVPGLILRRSYHHVSILADAGIFSHLAPDISIRN